MRKIKLRGNNVLLQPITKDRVTPAGLFIRGTADFFDADRHWIVAAIGPGKFVKNKRTKVQTLVPIELEPGDKVLVDMDSRGGAKTRLDDGRVIVDADQVLVKW